MNETGWGMMLYQDQLVLIVNASWVLGDSPKSLRP
jgi:hypothetical protein